MPDLYRRLCVSSITIALVVCLIVFAFHPVFQYFVAGFVALLAGVAIWEYEQFAKAKGGRLIMPALIILSIVEVLSFFLNEELDGFKSLPIIFFFIAFLILFALHFEEKEGAIVDLAVSSFGLLYIAVPMGMILGILYSSGVDGRWWITYLLVVTKITDVGAYFAGSLWGRRKLAPNISPKKTIEGAVFGLACAILASYLFHLASDYAGTFHLGMYEWLFLGLILGAVGQFGDLSESLLKRDANKKDSNALPGLGGVLDALDSILFNAPIIFIYLHFMKI
ncbi:MAG: phosphatidate cytidylyltransferase [Parachlamydiales bacterium]|nr:phosphatidate cytidylyltransferase [Parachlamydiales bacterium]